MGSLTSLLNLSQTALVADQSALNITANNVSNQNTPGYAREVATWQSGDTVTINGGFVSTGPSVSTVSQRDRVLDQRLQQQTQIQSQSSTLSSALTQIENIFGLSSTSTSAASTTLGTSIDSLFNSFSALAANPTDTATRQSVLSAANTLAGSFNSAASQLSGISAQLDQQVPTIVAQINSLTSAIASLNHQISSVSPNGDAGILEDQRQQDITQLSQYIGLNQITTENNGITLTTSNGSVLVGGSTAYPMSTSNIGGTTHVFAGAGPQQDVTATLTGGQLGGIVNARDQEIPAISSQLDQLTYWTVSAVNERNLLGIDANGNPGLAIFVEPVTIAGSAASLSVLMTDPQLIAAAARGQGTSGNGNATAFSNLATTNIVSGETASGYLAAFLGQLGSAVQSANTDSTAQQATLSQLTTQVNSLSGVSLDEEAANLTNYQRSYEAASKVFTIVDTLLASAINLGEQTTVT